MNIILIACLLALAVVELAASITWSPIYFRFGIPDFWSRKYCDISRRRLPSSEQLQRALDTAPLCQLKVKRVGRTRFAVRETLSLQMFRVYYPWMMRGVVTYDLSTGKVQIVGLANFVPFAIIVMCLFMWSGGYDGMFGIIAAFIAICSYLVQVVRFRRVVAVAVAIKQQPLSHGPPSAQPDGGL